MENNNSKENNQTNVSQLALSKEADEIKEAKKEIENIEKEELSNSNQTQTAFSQESSEEVSEQVEERLKEQSQEQNKDQLKVGDKTENGVVKGFDEKGNPFYDIRETKTDLVKNDVDKTITKHDEQGNSVHVHKKVRIKNRQLQNIRNNYKRTKENCARRVKAVKNFPKDVKNKVVGKYEQAKQTYEGAKKTFNSSKEAIAKAKEDMKDIKGAGGKAAIAAKAAQTIASNISNNETVKKIADKVGVIAKGMEAFKKLKRAYEAAQKVVQWIISNIKPIAIVSLCILVATVVILTGYSFLQSIGMSPHYYCDFVTDDDIKKTQAYRQYCGGHGGGYDLEELNGHYITQIHGGACTCCSYANLLMRYYSVCDIDFFEYLWREPDGLYHNLVHCNTASFGGSQDITMRNVVNGCGSNSQITSGKYSTENWQYMPFNEMDMLLDNTDPSLAGTRFSLDFGTGYQISIDDITATYINCTDEIQNGTVTFQELIEEHPCGVIAWNRDHMVLITRYDDSLDGGTFFVVDPWKSSLGFEEPATKVTTCVNGGAHNWNEQLKSNPSAFGIVGYIEEDDGTLGGN